jgi:hypothetical protein
MIPVNIPVRPVIGRYVANHGASFNGQIPVSIPQSSINSNMVYRRIPPPAYGQQAARGTYTASVTENLSFQSRSDFKTNQRVPPCMYSNGMRTKPVIQMTSTVQREEENAMNQYRSNLSNTPFPFNYNQP